MKHAVDTAEKKEDKEPKSATIYVNGTAHTVEKKDELTFNEVVACAYPSTPPGGDIGYSVMYERGHGDKPEGTLVEGQSVRVKDGLRFHVTATDRS